MPTLFRIPLQNIPQQFTIELSGVSYTMVCKWNDSAGCWMIDLGLESTGESLAAGMPLVTGCDLLAQYRFLGIPGSLFVYTEGDEFAPPTLDNLGLAANMYYYATEQL